MKIVSDSLTMVIIGDWNKKFLEPSWLASKVFGVEKLDIEFFGNIISPKVKYKSQDFSITPSLNKVQIACSNLSEEGVREFENLCNSFLQEALSPLITAYGFNLIFEEDDTVKYSKIVDSISDKDLLVRNGATVESTEISRNLQYKDNRFRLGFSINKGSENKLLVRINSHQDCNSPSKDIKIPEGRIGEFKSNCLELLGFLGYLIEEED